MIHGALNFRAVAPVATTGGRLRARALFRSGTLEGMGARAGQMLKDAGIGTVFDLRSVGEIDRYPAPLAPANGIRLIAAGHNIRLGDLSTVVRNPEARPEDIRAAMIRVYRDMPAQFAAVLKLTLDAVAAAPGPVLVNCTAGKDRTGAAVALILSALGVHRDDIFADYLLSRQAGPALMAMLRTRRGEVDYARMPEALLTPLHAADESYLAAFFETIDRDHGGTGRYLADSLGLDAARRAALAERLVDAA